ncbi:transposase [Paraburkholderia silvatlantica]|nr:transposase [Paraburkholderia silvatlantica]PXW31136.1 transposase [Paraburkholderia silvatlantica]
MKRFIEGEDRKQVTLLPECLDDFVAEDNPVRIIEAFVEELDLASLGFDGAMPSTTGRPSYHPGVLLKIYIYGYLNRVQSSRRLERECQRNVELMWLTGRLAPDFKTIVDFRRDNGTGIRNVCRRFVVLCRELKLFSQALVAIDGSKFKAVNTRDRNFTEGKVEKRQKQIEESIQRYLNALETADRTQPAELEAKTTRLQDKIARLREQMRNLDQITQQLKTQPDGQLSMTDPDARSMATSGKGSGMVGYNVQVAVDAKHHLIVAHEVTNSGSDRAQLSPMAKAARRNGQKQTARSRRSWLLQWASDQGVRRCGGCSHAAKADNVGSETPRPIRQGRLHLHCAGRRIPMSSWGAGNLPLHQRGTRDAAAPILEQRLSAMQNKVTVHAQRPTTDKSMGA